MGGIQRGGIGNRYYERGKAINGMRRIDGVGMEGQGRGGNVGEF